MEFKAFVALVVIILSVAGYAPYIWDILKRKTQPHVFTWLVTTFTASITYALQVLGGAGVGALPMLIIGVICGIVTLLSLWRGTKDITKSDVLCLVLSLVGLYLWLIVKQPVWSVLLVTLAEVISFIPTIRKSWKDPYSETLALYEISMFRHALAIVALENINILTALYPAVWSLANLTLTTVLLVRRRQIPRKV